MTESLAAAKATIKAAIETKTAELMAEVIRRVTGEIAESMLDDDVDVVDAQTLADAIIVQLDDYDFTRVLLDKTEAIIRFRCRQAEIDQFRKCAEQEGFGSNMSAWILWHLRNVVRDR